jgi:hypothetical protein
MISVAAGLPWLAAEVFNASFNALTEGRCVTILVSRAPGAPTVWEHVVARVVVLCRRRRRRDSVSRVNLRVRAISKTQE